jgi:hypothetical protein
MANRPDKALPGARFSELMAYDGRGERIWATAPRSYFASDPDHRRWNQRFAGKPVAATQGAFRVRVIETPRGKRRWQLQFVVGVKGFSVSSYNDWDEVEGDAGLFRPRLHEDRLPYAAGHYGLLPGGRLTGRRRSIL